MGVLEQVLTLTRAEAIEKIAAAGIREYGVDSEPVTEKWSQFRRTGKPVRVAAAINNADTDGTLLEILKQFPESVLEGLAVTAHLLEAEEVLLQLPEDSGALMEELAEAARSRGICVRTGFIDVRKTTEYLWHHIAVMKDIHDLFSGSYQPGIYVSVNGNELTRYPADKKIAELVETTSLKALAIGYRLYPLTVLEQTLAEVGVPNGRLNVYTAADCIVQEARERTMDFRKASCGKCVFCREGLIQLNGMMRDIAEGKGKREYPEILKEVGSAMTDSCLCSLGQEAAGFVLDAVEIFREELDDHIKRKRCPAQACPAFQLIYIDPHSCQGCGECQDVCPADCIDGKSGFIHMIDEFECIKCGKCADVCVYDAVVRTTGRVPKLPNRLIKCGKFKKH